MKPDHELDEEQEADRKFFEANPGRRIYLRPARGWERSKGDDLTAVVQIVPGVRVTGLRTSRREVVVICPALARRLAIEQNEPPSKSKSGSPA